MQQTPRPRSRKPYYGNRPASCMTHPKRIIYGCSWRGNAPSRNLLNLVDTSEIAFQGLPTSDVRRRPRMCSEGSCGFA
ncbi:hypothetical protein Pdw03_6606 [Penicillium digitatum]|uniref:Uncharacterized protein n=1 Tax=Penicillium digitatum TaxID=36651 RepID=A0A7T6XK96_PENDI|nr:hypothetical protein Pdw03_6606 [Penicillium digitatum]